MPPADVQHIYDRVIPSGGGEDSLSLISNLIRPDTLVLDLGTGSGALGRHLSTTRGCTLDGVTYNSAEAELAGDAYRTLQIANLDTCELETLFEKGRYDHIVCADVLEHLKQPERILRSCAELLAPGGSLLVSVPNVGYAGLLAELLQGEFRYREEGLLDATHLRFFTRQSLLGFLLQNGWQPVVARSVRVELDASEFRAAIDSLPPSVARYLLATPNALDYQFIIECRPSETIGEDASPIAEAAWAPTPGEAHARFTSQVFIKHPDGYIEQRKRVIHGVMGDDDQTLTLTLPADPEMTGLRFDPADRPGFTKLRSIRIQDSTGQLIWEWNPTGAEFDRFASNGIVAQPALPTDSGVVLLLSNDDPWFELPLPSEVLDSMRNGACLEFRLGWPMSADYLAMAAHTDRLMSRIEGLRSEVSAHAAELDRLKNVEAANTALQDEKAALQSHAHAQAAEMRSFRNALDAKLAQGEQRIRALERQRESMIEYLSSIENSTVFRMTRPLVHAKMRLDRLIRPRTGTPSRPAPTPVPPPDTPVDVIVPVYRGLEDTRCCIESVLSNTVRTAYRLIVINDASPEPEVSAWLRACADRDARVILLENENNLGFVGTVNRGMSYSDRNDVLLLNSDAEVANDWLDRIRAAAYSDQRIASVTPFSNNATICSYPRFCADNALPPGYDTAALDALFAQSNAGGVSDVPTGVGFCMYIRRDSLDDVGLFDVERFGKGYGEENDFCMRAMKAGWRNVLAQDTFVRHAGGVSFGASKSARELEAGAVMRSLHPDYEALVHKHIAEDPAREARIRVDLARLIDDGTPLILAITHDRAGGTHRHIEELARHMHGRARFLSLRPGAGGETLLARPEQEEGFELAFRLPEELDTLTALLRDLGVGHVHFHHLLGHPAEIAQLPALLNVRYDFTAHDFYSICPQISLIDHTNRYCGEQGVDQCRQCLRRSPAPDGEDIVDWRERHTRFLQGARYVIAPSADTAARLRLYVANADIRVCPHSDLDGIALAPPALRRRLDTAQPIRIAVIGALSKLKGADVLEDVALLAARQRAPVEFHLLGYAYRNLATQPRASLTVHGAYEDKDLDRLLGWLEPDLIWFPAQCPETYSYTLSSVLKAGYPVMGANLGAIATRLAGRAWSWLKPWDLSPAEWLAEIESIRTQHFIRATPPSPPALPASDTVDFGAPWHYDQDYLNGIPARSGTAPLPPSEQLVQYRPGRHTGGLAVRHGARQALLRAVIRLRSTPLLRGVARRIPLRVQSRIKSWLNG